MDDLGILAERSWRGAEADRAALTAAARMMAAGGCAGRVLAAVVLGVAWEQLATIVTEETWPIERLLDRNQPQAERHAWRAVLVVGKLAREHANSTEGRSNAPTLGDLTMLVDVYLADRGLTTRVSR
jgi:hypothetical protein